MSKFVGTGPSSYEKRIYWAAAPQRLRNTVLEYEGATGNSFSLSNLVAVQIATMLNCLNS